ncbi:9100_t:CDS:2 [Scutellospora calospora]|uniref:9100_t:CDS:1 n=1 Tax=Scutellospora calospora TaxID=85575 RepID=A0ACA9MYI0_9GLOM|nr:9100_t:CDS:2 [Scutellospora calospora]
MSYVIENTNNMITSESRLKTISNRKCILCVDDNFIDLKITQKKVERLGYSTLLANTGQEAINILQSEFESLNFNKSNPYVLEDKMKPFNISLVLMDCMMPEMSGFDASIAIRSMNSQISNIPIVALTSSETKETFIKCIESGMNACLVKPLKTKQFSEILTQWDRNNIF